jgi:hypothetical protein
MIFSSFHSLFLSFPLSVLQDMKLGNVENMWKVRLLAETSGQSDARKSTIRIIYWCISRKRTRLITTNRKVLFSSSRAPCPLAPSPWAAVRPSAHFISLIQTSSTSRTRLTIPFFHFSGFFGEGNSSSLLLFLLCRGFKDKFHRFRIPNFDHWKNSVQAHSPTWPHFVFREVSISATQRSMEVVPPKVDPAMATMSPTKIFPDFSALPPLSILLTNTFPFESSSSSIPKGLRSNEKINVDLKLGFLHSQLNYSLISTGLPHFTIRFAKCIVFYFHEQFPLTAKRATWS